MATDIREMSTDVLLIRAGKLKKRYIELAANPWTSAGVVDRAFEKWADTEDELLRRNCSTITEA